MKIAIVTVLLMLAGFAKAQEKKPTADIKGNCNGTAVGTNITVTVKCEDGLNAAQSKAIATQYAEILRKIRQDSVNQKLNFDDMLERLKAIQDGLTDIKAIAKGRRLTPSQIRDLTAFAQTNPLTPDVFKFDYYASDLESTTYATDFMGALGIDPMKLEVTMMSGVAISGVEFRISSIDYRSRTPLPPACSALLSFLDSEFIANTKVARPDVQTGHCEIFVGYKPTI
jgi:hypothetical protein